MEHLCQECSALVVVLGFLAAVDGASISDKRTLQEYLFTNYTPEFRPLVNQSERIDVTAMFYLLDITNFDDVRQEFTCNGFFNITWKDEFLKWNSSDFGGVKKLTFVNEYKSWFPSITVTNSLGKRDVFAEDTQKMTVYSTGDVIWTPSAILKTSCSLNILLFPFDVQECHIFFMPVHYEKGEVRAVAGANRVNFGRYQKNQMWNILNDSLTAKIYGEFYKWDVSLRFQRRPLYYVLNLMIPIIIVSFLNVAAYAVPSQSGEKLSFSVTVLLSLSVYMTFVTDFIPKSSKDFSMLNGYLVSVTIFSSINVLITISILRIHNKSDREAVPECLKKLVNLTIRPCQRKSTEADDTSLKEYDIQWTDVSASLDYILLRVSLPFYIFFTGGFFIAILTWPR